MDSGLRRGKAGCGSGDGLQSCGCETQAELQGSLRAQPAAGLSRSVGEAREISEESHTVGV